MLCCFCRKDSYSKQLAEVTVQKEDGLITVVVVVVVVVVQKKVQVTVQKLFVYFCLPFAILHLPQ